ncbi:MULTISPECIES: hypothetical protein [Burkholderia]|uniref:hypothetical protein n=1 Tax=Burkholderia TaxID=32008 RepID=UPI0002FD67CE|nr:MULTISPECIES: hypothetical protein [Burkholderia]PRG34728.1 hypothetical protein C6T62_17640 [Burkholderia multivorans]
MRKHLITIALALAGLTLGTAHAAPSDPSLRLLDRDAHGHLTLNGVPMGVRIASFHECKGDPSTATAPCVLTAPEIDGYGTAEVHGLPPVKDGAGRLVFGATDVTTHNGTIDGVILSFADARYAKVFSDSTSETVGLPDFTDHNGVQEWRGVFKDTYIVVVPPDQNGEGAEYGIVYDPKP